MASDDTGAVTTPWWAQLGGAAHLYISMGSDTVPAIKYVMDNMGNRNDNGDSIMPGFSVAASEHNQMMSKGRDGEFLVVKRLLKVYPKGILSVVADTYDLFNFVERVSTGDIREMIMSRDGTFVIRPDSCPKKEDGSEMTQAETISAIQTHTGVGSQI
jgi:nicotinamide phosphoribosyltransferase